MGILKRILFSGVKWNFDEILELAVQEAFQNLSALMYGRNGHINRVAHRDPWVLGLAEGGDARLNWLGPALLNKLVAL